MPGYDFILFAQAVRGSAIADQTFGRYFLRFKLEMKQSFAVHKDCEMSFHPTIVFNTNLTLKPPREHQIQPQQLQHVATTPPHDVQHDIKHALSTANHR